MARRVLCYLGSLHYQPSGKHTARGLLDPGSAISLVNLLFIDHELSLNLEEKKVEVTKALATLQPLYGKDNVEIVTVDGQRVRGVVRSMKTTQALTTPSVKMECADGEIVKIPFPAIAEIRDHNGQ